MCCSRRRQPSVQRQDLRRPALARGVVAERVGGVADLALAGQEDEHVAGPLGADLVDGDTERLDRVGVGVVVGSVAHLDRVRATGHLEHRGAAEVRGEPIRVDGRRRDHHLQVGSAGKQSPQVAEDEVDGEAALVRLVDDDRVVAEQQRVALDLGHQQAVGHQLDHRVGAHLIGEADRVADGRADLGAHLLGEPLGDAARGDPPGLGVAHHAAAAPAQLEQHLRQLGGLAAAGLACEHHDLVVTQRGHDLVVRLADRQLRPGSRGAARTPLAAPSAARRPRHRRPGAPAPACACPGSAAGAGPPAAARSGARRRASGGAAGRAGRPPSAGERTSPAQSRNPPHFPWE